MEIKPDEDRREGWWFFAPITPRGLRSTSSTIVTLGDLAADETVASCHALVKIVDY